MDLLKRFGTFLGWLTGVLAGISALLYGFGFIASSVHFRMLGLDWASLSHDPSFYIALGGQVLIHWVLNAILVLLAVMTLGEALRWLRRRIDGDTALSAGRAGMLVRTLDRFAVWALALVLILCSEKMMDAFGGALSVTGLLFAPAASVCDGPAIVQTLTESAPGIRLARAGDVAMFSALAFGVGCYAALILRNRRPNPLLLFLVAAIGVQAAGAVPVAHGLFLADRTLLRVTDGEATALSATVGPLYALSRARDGIWLWEPAASRVHWLAGTELRHAGFGQPKGISAILCTGSEDVAG